MLSNQGFLITSILFPTDLAKVTSYLSIILLSGVVRCYICDKNSNDGKIFLITPELHFRVFEWLLCPLHSCMAALIDGSIIAVKWFKEFVKLG